MILFLLQAVVIFALLYFVPVLGALEDRAREVTLGVAASVFSAALLFFYDVVLATGLIDAEKSKLIKVQEIELEALKESATPRLVIDERLARKPNDTTHYLVVRNPSSTESLSECFARIEEMIHEASGAVVLSHAPLRTENQVGNRPTGRFNLDAELSKRIPIVAGGSGPGNFRVVLAESTPKFQNGNYTIRIRAYAKAGGPTKATVLVRGDSVTLQRET